MEYTHTVWMGNISNNITERDIISIFGQYKNRINDINIYYKNYNYGYAFIEFDSVKIAKRVIQQYNGRIVLGQYLNLNFGRENSNFPKKCNKIYTLFISNLDKDVDNRELYKYFKNKYESVKSACIIYKQNSNDSRGFGFLNLTSYIDFLDILRNNKPFILREKILIIKRAYQQYNDDNNSYHEKSDEYSNSFYDLQSKYNLPSPASALYSLMPSFSSKDTNAKFPTNNLLLSLIEKKYKAEKFFHEILNIERINSSKQSKEKIQESTSSNVSTVSDDDHKTNISTTNSNNGKKLIDEKADLVELIRTATKKITNYFNASDVFVTDPSVACHYYCNLTNSDGDERYDNYRNRTVEYFADTYKNQLKNKTANII